MQDKKDKKIAVVLFNLGGPLKLQDIKPFLFNFFMDENIIPAPKPIRYLLAKYISIKRSRGAALEAYSFLNGKSPLLENTKAQAEVLEKYLQEKINCKVFVSMRYWHPLVEQTIKEVEEYKPDQIVLLPLYPQYSTATSFSSLQEWYKKFKGNTECLDICCYPINSGFIKASAQLIKKDIEKAPQKFRLLFSAHGLPKKTIDAGDPYQKHCEQTAEAIVKELNLENLDWNMCYQSKVGKLEWIGPATDDEIKRAAKDEAGIIIYPLAFVSEHVETLVELDIEYKELAESLGIENYLRVPTVSTHKDFIEGLGEEVLTRINIEKYDKVISEKKASCGQCKKCYERLKNG